MSNKKQLLHDISRIIIDHCNSTGRFSEYKSLIKKYDKKVVKEALNHISRSDPDPDYELLWDSMIDEEPSELNEMYIGDDEPSEFLLEAYKENDEVYDKASNKPYA